jgi:hypothetical protein
MATNNILNWPRGTSGQLLTGSTGSDPVFAAPTSSTLDFTAGAGTLAINTKAVLKTDTGFATWTGAGAYFDDTTLGSFTLLRGGTGYIKGVPVSWAAPQTVSGMTAGNCYHIYVDNAGIIGKSAVRLDTLFEDYICLFECLRDSTPVTNNQITVKENHPYSFPVASSNYDHNIIGSVIENRLNGANITLKGTQQIQINGTDQLDDHGLETDIPDSAGAAITWRKFYTTAAGKWALYNDTDTFTGHYNNSGTVTALGVGRYALYTLYASKDSLNTTTPTYFAVLDATSYSSTSNANTAISNGTAAKATNELAMLEVVQLGYIMFRQSTNAINQVTISKSTLRQTLSTGGTNTASLVNTVTTDFNSILSAADTNVQSALDTIDDYGISPKATGDSGGFVSTTSLTNVVDTTQGAGALTILSTNGNAGTNTGFIKMYVGNQSVWIPYWITIAP